MSSEDPLMYSQFCYYIQKDEEKRRATMHIPRKPGEQIEVDWAGDPAHIIDPDTGEITEAWIFVGVLTYSQYAFVKAYMNEKTNNWIKAHVQMFDFFGGVAPMLVSDNCTTAVNHEKSDWYTTSLNTTYHEMAEHYNLAIIPARVRKPKDKPNVEGSVGKISTWITAALRNEQFFSLAELNDSIREKLNAYNARKFQKKLQEETNSSFTLYIVQGRISLYEFKRFYDENKNVFLEKYLEGVGEIRKLDCSQVQELGKEQIVVSSKKNLSMENMLKEPDSQIRIQMLHEILSIARTDGVEQFINAAQAGYTALKHAYEKIETGKEVPRIASCWKEWLDAARITAWLEKQVNHYHEYMTREVNGYSRVISDAVEYICRSFRNPDLSLNDVAAYVHLSPGYLSGEFKRETGVTLKSYLTDIRIEAAKKMMEDGNYKIYEICSAVGYNSSQYFSQAFYKKTGMFPTEYSKKGGRKNEK